MWDLMQQLGEQTLPELFSRSLFVLKNKTVMNFFFFCTKLNLLVGHSYQRLDIVTDGFSI